MSKKQKRQVSQGSGSATPSRQSTPAAVTFSRRPATQAEFKPDYSHVVSDLKRIGMLAGSFFIILIILSFILK